MRELKFLFRADEANAGDWWCPPFRYFPFRSNSVGDIIDEGFGLHQSDILILGGGGIGTQWFKSHLDRISGANVGTTIVWGAGVDTTVDIGAILPSSQQDLYGSFFDFASDVGIRVYSEPQKFRYVPCASCMNALFFKYRDNKPKSKFGFYEHKDVPIVLSGAVRKTSVLSNSGTNIEDKLNFMSNFEYIVTNTYHGVYWATLLERKVIVTPFKSGLFSFKHKPEFCFDGIITEKMLDSAKRYEGVLEESRKLNLEFYSDLNSKYGLA